MPVYFSCEKEGIDVFTVEGIIRDDVSMQPISMIPVSIDAIKPPTGVGIITDGKRERVGRASTDANGYYKVKLKVFEEAKRLEFYVNRGIFKEGYAQRREDVYLSEMNRSGSNKMDYTLSPTALLIIKFRNEQPVSDSDFFYFRWYADGNGWTRGWTKMENCGTVTASEALTWTGKNVCGAFNVETIAEQFTHVYWTVTKNSVMKDYSDSVYIKRGVINEFSLNY